VLRTLHRKLLLAGGGLLLGVAIAAAFIITNVLLIRGAVDHLTTHTVEELQLTGHFNTDVFGAIMEAESFVRSHDPLDRAEALTELRDARTILDQLSGGTPSSEALDQDLDAVQTNLQQQRVAALAAVDRTVLRVLDAAEHNDTTALARTLADLTAIETAVETIEDRSSALADQSMGAATAAMNTVIQRAIMMTAGLFCLFALAVLGLLLFMRQTILRPITQLATIARMVAEGNLHQTIAITSDDEVGSLQATFNHMINNLHQAWETVLEYQGTLEARVVERTTELAVSNTHLQLELAERIRAEAALEVERAVLERRVAERTADLSLLNVELARTAQLKDEFLAGMSHELRTPLNAVLGLSEALQEDVYGPLTDRQRRSLHSIEASGRHLLDLITDILDLAKIGAGKLELALEPASIATICQASLRLITQLAHTKRLSVDLALDPTVTLFHVDARRMKQILVNLLSNAVKFTPEGGSIGLEVAGDAARQAVDLTVWDSGIGIAQEQMPRLFQPFVQLDSRLARQYEGTGLGLALVYRMVELHGGSISVTSDVGHGSRFRVALPWHTPNVGAPARAPTEPEVIVPAPRATGISTRIIPPPVVLLAEDNEATITMIADYLDTRGYQVVMARNGTEALDRASDSAPALILMDIQMPDMDGLEAIRRIRADTRLAAIPMIALTALAMPGDRERCLAAGANDYLSKPVSLKGLVTAIDAHLRHATASVERVS
jgi:signal transduction histidine kinase/ActR/RegA family two-component response regulator